MVAQLQLLSLSALIFFLFLKLLKRTETISIDTDWFYRKGGRLFYYLMDKSLNGINRFANRVFVEGLAGFVGRISRRGPEIFTLGVLIPLWSVSGLKGEKLQGKIETARAALQTGTAPVGIGAALATVFLVIIFLLN